MHQVIFTLEREIESMTTLFYVTGVVQGYDDDTDEWTQVGTVEALWYPNASMMRQHFAQDTGRMFCSLDLVDDESARVAMSLHEHWSDKLDECYGLLVVTAIKLDPQVRGARLGYFVLREVLRLASPEGALVLCKPHPILTEDEITEAETERAVARLQQYWFDFGLRPLGTSGYYIHNMAYRWPEGNHACNTDD